MPAMPGSEWPCGTCTLLNTRGESACRACGGPRLDEAPVAPKRRKVIDCIEALKAEGTTAEGAAKCECATLPAEHVNVPGPAIVIDLTGVIIDLTGDDSLDTSGAPSCVDDAALARSLQASYDREFSQQQGDDSSEDRSVVARLTAQDVCWRQRRDVRSFLARAAGQHLKVESIQPNAASQPGQPLYSRFKAAYGRARDKGIRMVFHGTAVTLPPPRAGSLLLFSLPPGAWGVPGTELCRHFTNGPGSQTPRRAGYGARRVLRHRHANEPGLLRRRLQNARVCRAPGRFRPHTRIGDRARVLVPIIVLQLGRGATALGRPDVRFAARSPTRACS